MEPSIHVTFLTSQRNDIKNILIDHGLATGDFAWTDVPGERPEVVAKKFSYKDTPYHFIFDRLLRDDGNLGRWICTYSPALEDPSQQDFYDSWNAVTQAVGRWVGFMKRELDAEDPWAEETAGFAENFSQSNEQFTQEELGQLDVRLDAVRQFLLENTTAGATVQQQITEGIEDLKQSARTMGKKDWALLFVGWFVSHSAEWALEHVHWHDVAKILIQGARFLVLGDGS